MAVAFKTTANKCMKMTIYALRFILQLFCFFLRQNYILKLVQYDLKLLENLKSILPAYLIVCSNVPLKCKLSFERKFVNIKISF